MLINKLKQNIKSQREEENAMAEIEKQKALLEYVAIMADVEIPIESDGDMNEQLRQI